MGNKVNRKKKAEIHLNEKLNKEISESLGLSNNSNKESISLFKEGLKKNLRRKLYPSSKVNSYLNEDDQMLHITHKLLASIYDSNVNYMCYKENLNNNFFISNFLYDIIQTEEANEHFVKEKIFDISNIFSVFSKESPLPIEEVGMMTKTLEFNALKVSKSSEVCSDEEGLINSNAIKQINELSIKRNSLQKDEMKNSFSKPMIMETLRKNLAQEVKEIKEQRESSFMRPKQNEKIDKSINETMNKDQCIITDISSHSRSKSKTKKRVYNKAPIVNIKIDIKDFIKQDALEKSFLTERNDKQKKEKENSNLKLINISKDHTITQVNDNSFVDLVDVFAHTKREYIDARKKKTPSKSPRRILYNNESNFSSVNNSYVNNSQLHERSFPDERINRINYRNNNRYEQPSPIRKRDNILDNIKSARKIK